ncbi:MAG: AbrB/MazE/SpoVT family DNA-binding domain-containing protein [Bryobacterales bacterium]|nr:AbrB/MazE/SpoVT family DNA-binding domain-containing protein [Bryobacterales bacterium]MDE0264377.1 AbrB/MazE/SpoVT family DNA-binding domain-containing protein [Bryobacterales bacterium]MDE0621877.1 AbrB/MazE/SpoVT family DNA-binding domain-containing protein [Bryobacterales bacterium]
MRINSKGQVTIPVSLRLRLGLLPNTEVVFEESQGGALIRPAARFRELLEERLRKASGVAADGPSTDEILQLTRGEK